MAALDHTLMTLRFMGDDLDPIELTRLLGKTPTHAGRKGDIVRAPPTGHAGPGQTRTEKTGGWHLDAKDRAPGDLDAQVAEILSGMTDDLEIWKDLAARFRVDIFCGLFMSESDEGISLSPHTVALLGERGISIELCCYAPVHESPGSEPT